MIKDKKMLFSVVVTSYNYEQYIRQTLESLVAQTYKDFEVIIVDDGSQDNSVNIIKEFTEKYTNFHLYTHENNQNKGLIESLKLGLSKVSSEYVAFLESDDYWSEDYLQEKFDYINKHPKSVCVINDIQIFGNDTCDEYIKSQVKYYKNHLNNKNHFEHFYHNNGIATFSEVLIKSDLIKTLDFKAPIPAWIDWWLWRQVAIKYPISFLDKVLTYWNRHDNSYISYNEDENNRRRSEFKRLSNTLLLNRYPCYYIRFKFKRGIQKIFKNIFSITNDEGKRHKVITICGFKIAIRRKV